jgi:ubiquinone/menaquinone biosynthesis C-methylase UbiE
LTKYLSDFPKGGNILDCGCGTGIISNFLYEKDFNVHSMDLSFTSLKLTNKTHGLNVIHASNLELPFKDNFFDVVISSGVVHHTPDAKKSVEELTRVLRPDGLLYLLIYRKPSIPFLEYSTIGALVRKLIKYKYGKKLVDHILVPIAIPIIYVGKSMIFKTLKHSKFQEYKNYFYDRYATPQATFHRKKEVESWFASSRVTVVDYYKGNFGYHHNFVCRKEH